MVFGLRNIHGSCWINGCLQALFRIPELQTRYSTKQADKENPVDLALQKVWLSKGEDGLQDLFEIIRTVHMPAGRGIGDSHELLNYLCDKIPLLNELCRFKIGNVVECVNCKHREIREDSVTEFSLTSDGKYVPISDCIRESVISHVIDDWTCEKCSKKGCTKQQLIGTFPKVMVFHMVSPEKSVDYSSLLVLNNRRYALSSVICYNGSHWWTRGRNMPPGLSWYTFDDQTVTEHGSKQFPVSNMMRILIYYRLEN
jgi:ubiquitin C-terminal hydrolase